jgi:hypothetical protein
MSIEATVWLPLVSGLIGALVGGAASVMTVLVQARHETKRHRIAVLSDLAVKEVDWAYRIITDMKAKGAIPPPVLYMHFYDKILNLFESGNFTLEEYQKLSDENNEFLKLLSGIDAVRRTDTRED